MVTFAGFLCVGLSYFVNEVMFVTGFVIFHQ